MKRLRIRDLIDDGAIIAVQDGNHGEKHPTAADYVDKGIPFLMARDFRDGRLDLQRACKISKALGDSLRIGFAVEGDVLLTHKGTVGLTGIVPSVDDYVMLTPQVTYYRVDPEKLSSLFLRYAFQSPLFQSQLASFSAQSTRPYIGITAQKELCIDVPDLDSQLRIAGILSAYDDLIENSQRRIKILEEMARRLYREWFVYLRFPGHEDCRSVESPLGEIPEGWEVKRLGEVVELNYGKALKKQERLDGPFPVFGSSGQVGTHALSLTKGPGIVVGRKGNVGSVFWCDDDFFVIDTAYFVTSALPLRFLYYLFPSLNFINSDAAVPGLSRNQAYSLEIIVPPVALLDSFCEQAEILEGQAGLLARQIQNIRRTRDLLLPRLLSGLIDIEALPNPDLSES
jgi:type I restriction enzyme S subunit